MLHGFAHPLRRLQVAAFLDPVQASHHLRGRDGTHGQGTDPRKNVQLEVAHHFFGVAGRPLAILLGLCMPRAGGQFKGVETCNAVALLFHAARLSGVDAIGALLGLCTRLLACSRKRHHWIVP
ncbi:hypothetical protein FQZ97_1101560 [compost metagenome]